MGALLGSREGKSVRVTNSFAIPFEEDERDGAVFFADHTYIENFAEMARKVNARGKCLQDDCSACQLIIVQSEYWDGITQVRG